MFLGRGTPPFRCTAGRRVCVPAAHTLFFSHTDLVPTVGPGSKDPVTAPITGLRSFSNNTIAPLRRRNRGVPSGAEMKAFGRGAQGQSASVGLRRMSSQAGLTLRIRFFFSFRAVFGPSGSQSAGVTCDSSDRNWPITLPAGGLLATSRPFCWQHC